MFKKILIANRGEIACRVIKTARKMGIATVAVYSDADRNALHVRMADEAIHIGPPPANQSYIVIDRIMDAIRESGAEAVHPGYGFLSENPKFAEALAAENVAFIGPPVGAIEAMGDKITSKKLAAEAGVSTVPGYMGLIGDADESVKIASEIGYPVMIKASAGGGGKGMRIAWNDEEAREGFQSSKNEAAASFGDDRIFIEKFVTQPRHIEIQVLGDSHGNCIYLGERECSIQRRNQKVIEEAPSPFLDAATRKAMGEQAVALAKAVEYASAGTVEFIVDGDRNFYFLEMNTRLQVEHPVTELITGIDLVEQMIRVAAGEPLSISQHQVELNGWAMESRIYAEDPYRNFLPSIGRLTRYRPPAESAQELKVIRNDTGVYEGGEISMYYDPMIAKLCSWAPDRPQAIEAMRTALDAFELEGIGHNIPFLSAVMDHPKFASGDITTAFIAEEYPDGFSGVSAEVEVLGNVAALATLMQHITEAFQTRRVSGQLREAMVPKRFERAVALAGHFFHVSGGPAGPLAHDVLPLPSDPFLASPAYDVRVCETGGEARNLPTSIEWQPGNRLAVLRIHRDALQPVETTALEQGEEAENIFTPVNPTSDVVQMVCKIDRRAEGFRIRYRGADLDVKVRSPRAAELAALMPEKLPPDTSRLLLCPMPGQIVSVAVEEGQEVQDGQILCTVEAMKMENVLRAEKKGIVAKVNVAAGDSLAVDDVILEFE